MIATIGLLGGVLFAYAAVPQAERTIRAGRDLGTPLDLSLSILTGLACLYTYLTVVRGFDWVLTLANGVEALAWSILLFYRIFRRVKPVRIYVASAFANKDEVRQVQAQLRGAGHSITHDWTLEDASHLPHGSPEFYSYLERCGEADFRGVCEADVVVVIAHSQMSDTKVEMGIAIGLGLRVFVLYAERRHSVFYGYTVRLGSVPELLQAL